MVASNAVDPDTRPARTVALLLAAGSGERIGLPMPKAFAPVRGRSLLERCLLTIARVPQIEAVVVVCPAELRAEAANLAARITPAVRVADVVAGGRTRQESVQCGMASVPPGTPLVVCHDAARPFASPGLFARVIAALGDRPHVQGVIPVIPVPDTVKRVRGATVLETVPRDELVLAQTPQAFVTDALGDAHARASAEGFEATDDAMLLERAGYRVVAVAGEAGNFKITSPDDLLRAERLVEESAPRG